MTDDSDRPIRWGQPFEQLLHAARAGSPQALGRLLDGFRLLLMAEANRNLPGELRGKGGASDLVQETLLEALRDFGQFQGATEKEFLRWLSRILAHNVANFVDRFTTGKRDIALEIVTADSWVSRHQAAGAKNGGPSPSELASQREEQELFRQALDRLADEDRMVIYLRHQDWTFLEIGSRLGITKEAARKRFGRAVETLHGQYQQMLHERRAQLPQKVAEGGS
jgi:RNA polymerase sigma-70 factor (ECF subfamily)